MKCKNHSDLFLCSECSDGIPPSSTMGQETCDKLIAGVDPTPPPSADVAQHGRAPSSYLGDTGSTPVVGSTPTPSGAILEYDSRELNPVPVPPRIGKAEPAQPACKHPNYRYVNDDDYRCDDCGATFPGSDVESMEESK